MFTKPHRRCTTFVTRMKKFVLHLFALVSFFVIASNVSATHNRAGEITYMHMGGMEYKVIVTTYTKASAIADRPWLKIRWGDEPSDITEAELDSLPRTNGDGEVIPGTDIQKNTYEGEHIYAGPGSFTLSVEDPNRNAGVLNINNGEPGSSEDEKTSTSVMAVFAISSVLVISPGLDGHNNSVLLTNPPIQDACIFQPWEHNPAAYDIDGDELVFSLTSCLGTGALPLLGWESPDDYTDSADDTFTINPQTGDLSWLEPLVAGEYNIAILIQEFRNGDLVGSVLRDMQITVVNCNNQPPVINPLPDYCIDAGGPALQFIVSASDPNNDDVIIEAYSGIFINLENNATWNSNTNTFTWAPQCEEVRAELYYVSFAATDDGNPNLTDIETVSIRVVAPSVENPIATAEGNQITLTWDATPCLAIFPSFELPMVSYEVYRHVGFTGWTPDQCELGVPAYTGYSLIGTVTGANTTSFVDTDVVFGGQYCYLIVTIWPDGAVSYASAEVCAIIQKEAPVIIKASIGATDITLGRDTVAWSDPSDLDTSLFPGPYHYRLYHGIGLSQPTELIFTSADFTVLDEGQEEFIHENINTADTGHNYRVEIYSDGELVNSSANASTVFLQPIPNDNQVTLNMIHATPWENYEFAIYRKAPGETNFSLYAITDEAVYTDDSLTNNQVYCYYVVSLGTYGSPGVPDSLFNWSQEVCTRPYDQTPPCPPVLDISHDCAEQTVDMVWNDPNESCADDVTAYNIYYAPVEGQPLQLIATIDGSTNTTYLFVDEEAPISIAGCYAVTAIDSLNLWPDGELYQNESEFSNIFCLDNCPIYFLPNIFSPNGDEINDLFVPFEYRYIESIDMQIFNRWGNLVFETNDPAILWDGKNKDSKSMSSDGAYYYTIRVNTIRLSGIVTEDFSGSIQLMDGEEFGGNGQ